MQQNLQRLFIKSKQIQQINSSFTPISYNFGTLKRDTSKKSTQTHSQNTGKALFKSLYFPLKRINFEKQDYQKIFEASKLVIPDKLKAKMAGIYFAPVLVYGLNFTFFLDFQNYWHYGAMSGLMLYAIIQSYKKLAYLNARIAEVWIDKEGENFILTQRYNKFFEQFDQKLALEHSKIDEVDRLSFKFGIDDIMDIKLVAKSLQDEGVIKTKEDTVDNVDQVDFSQDLDDWKKEQKEKIEKRKKQSKEAPFQITSEMQEDTLEITLKTIDEKNQEYLTFFIDINQNELKSYNDYLIALGMKQRLVLNSSKMAQQKEESKENESQKQN